MPNLRIGAHTSVAGGLQKSFERSYNIGANCFQIFTKSPRGWFFVFEGLSKSQIEESLAGWDKYKQTWGIIHSVYLVNLAKPFSESEKDIKSVIDDFLIAEKLGFQAVNVHLGKYGSMTKEEAISNMSINLGYILEQIRHIDAYFVFENTAGQGSEIGWNFEELGYLYNYLLENLDAELVKSKVKFCFDTAHAWGGGYDINKWDEIVADYDKFIGIDKLYCFHLNDAKVPVGSKLDRHASLGRGFIGLPALSKVIKWAYENDRPLIIETPEEEIWPQEIEMIKHICDGSFDQSMIKDFHNNNFRTQSLKKFEKTEDGIF